MGFVKPWKVDKIVPTYLFKSSDVLVEFQIQTQSCDSAFFLYMREMLP